MFIINTNNLKLIKDTIAVNNLTAEKGLIAEKGMRINTSNYNDVYKGLELCNKEGNNCYNFYVENNDLKVKHSRWNQTSNILFSYIPPN